MLFIIIMALSSSRHMKIFYFTTHLKLDEGILLSLANEMKSEVLCVTSGQKFMS